MSNIDPIDICLLQDLTGYRLAPFLGWPTNIVPLLFSGIGDYWIANKYVGLSETRSVKAAAVLSIATLLLFRLLSSFGSSASRYVGIFTLPWGLMWIDVILLASLKWFILKYVH